MTYKYSNITTSFWIIFANFYKIYNLSERSDLVFQQDESEINKEKSKKKEIQKKNES